MTSFTTFDLISSFHHTVRNLLAYIGSLMLKVAFLIGLAIAYIINAIFFTLLFLLVDFPSWIMARTTSSDVDHVPQTSNNHILGYPEGWVRVSLCRTDRISELDLEAGGADDVEDGNEEQQRPGFSRQESEQRVGSWLERMG